MNDTDLSKVRDRAVELLRQGWCQGTYARDKGGADLIGDYDSLDDIPGPEQACSWCLTAAIAVALSEVREEDGDYYEEFNDFNGKWMACNEDVAGCVSQNEYNDYDNTTQEDVIASLQRMDFTKETDDARESVS